MLKEQEIQCWNAMVQMQLPTSCQLAECRMCWERSSLSSYMCSYTLAPSFRVSSESSIDKEQTRDAEVVESQHNTWDLLSPQLCCVCPGWASAEHVLFSATCSASTCLFLMVALGPPEQLGTANTGSLTPGLYLQHCFAVRCPQPWLCYLTWLSSSACTTKIRHLIVGIQCF